MDDYDFKLKLNNFKDIIENYKKKFYNDYKGNKYNYDEHANNSNNEEYANNKLIEILYTNNDKYLGEHNNFIKNGYGLLISNNFIYLGQFINDKRDGIGIIIYNDCFAEQ